MSNLINIVDVSEFFAVLQEGTSDHLSNTQKFHVEIAVIEGRRVINPPWLDEWRHDVLESLDFIEPSERYGFVSFVTLFFFECVKNRSLDLAMQETYQRFYFFLDVAFRYTAEAQEISSTGITNAHP